MFNRKGDAASAVEELEEEAARCHINSSAINCISVTQLHPMDPSRASDTSSRSSAVGVVIMVWLNYRTFELLIAPFRTAPTARVERRHDLANILSTVCLSWRSIRNKGSYSIEWWSSRLRLGEVTGRVN